MGTTPLRFLPLALVLVLCSCAHTRMASLPNPNWTPRDLHRVLVFFASDDLEVRQSFEARFGQRADLRGVEFVPSYTVFFPGRELTQEEVVAGLMTARIDALLLVTQGESGISTSVTPTSSSTGCTIWTSSQGCVQTRTTVSGGDRVTKPWASYSVELLDVQAGVPIWVATARSGGNGFASWEDLRNSLTDKLSKQLMEDGIVRR